MEIARAKAKTETTSTRMIETPCIIANHAVTKIAQLGQSSALVATDHNDKEDATLTRF